MSEEKQVAKTNGGLKSLINSDSVKAQFEKLLPKHMNTERYVRVATTALTRVPNLANCTPQSFMCCLLDLSARGLEPDGRLAHLIPYKNNKAGVYECTLIIDYKGKIDIIMRSGDVRRIHTDVVCENDDFEYNMGQIIKHKIDFRKPRGDVYAAYAMFEMTNGSHVCRVLSKEEIEKVRQSSPGKNSPAWVNWWNEMAKKTAVHNGSKLLRLSPEIRETLDEDTLMPTVDIDAIDIPAAEPPKRTLDDIAADHEPPIDLDSPPENEEAGSPPFDDDPEPEKTQEKKPSRSELNQMLLKARQSAKWGQRQLDEEIEKQFGDGVKLADITDDQVMTMIEVIENYYERAKS